MYYTIPETAQYLKMPENQVLQYIITGKIRAVHDGEQFFINHDQFQQYFSQLDRAKQLLAQYWQEILLPDRDIKDED